MKQRMPRINLRLPEIFGPKLTWKKEITPIGGIRVPKTLSISKFEINKNFWKCSDLLITFSGALVRKNFLME